MSAFTPEILASDMRVRAVELGASHPAHKELMTFAAAAITLASPVQTAPQCARCLEPLSQTDVVFADGRHCCHCFNAIPKQSLAVCPNCRRSLSAAQAVIAHRVGACGLCGDGPDERAEAEFDARAIDIDQEAARA